MYCLISHALADKLVHVLTVHDKTCVITHEQVAEQGHRGNFQCQNTHTKHIVTTVNTV